MKTASHTMANPYVATGPTVFASAAATARRVSAVLMDVNWTSQDPSEVTRRARLAEASQIAGRQAAEGQVMLEQARSSGFPNTHHPDLDRAIGRLDNAIHYLSEGNPGGMKRLADPAWSEKMFNGPPSLVGMKHALDTLQIPAVELGDRVLREINAHPK